MTASFVNQAFGYPAIGYPNTTPSLASHTVDATNDGVGWLFEALTADPITHLGFLYGLRSGTPPQFIIAIESAVVSTGAPDGTPVGGGTPASKTFTPPADTTWDNTWQWLQLDNAFTPTLGNWYMITIRYNTGTIDGSNNSTIVTHCSNMSDTHGEPYAVRLTAGTWAKQTPTPIYGLRTANNRYGNIMQSFYNTRSASTAGLRVAMAFKLQCAAVIRGMRFCGSMASAGGKAPIFGLWSDSGVVQSRTLDSDISAGTISTAYVTRRHLLTTFASLSAETQYYMGLEVADAVSGGVLMNGYQLAAAADMDAFPSGADINFATYNGSVWSIDTTVRPMAELWLGSLTTSGGSSDGRVIGGGIG